MTSLDDGQPTATTRAQLETESTCSVFFVPLDNLPTHEIVQLQRTGFLNDQKQIRLLREKHIPYLMRGLEYLPSGFSSLDASRPWIIYWILHALELLDATTEITNFTTACINTLRRCWSSDFNGGFGGGILQLGHLATTYASCLSLAIIGTPEAYNVVDRKALLQFFLSLKDPVTGAFHAHEDGYINCVLNSFDQMH
jgi:protein farnesyltransferase subunit beta